MSFATAAWPFSVEPRAEDTSLLIVGDTNVGGRDDPASAFAEVAATLRAADGVVGQMEGMLTTPSDDPGRPDIPFKSWWRHSEPEVALAFRASGFAAVACASNVAYPPAACVETRQVCAAAGLAMAGVGRDRGDARAPAIVEFDRLRLGLLSYTSVFHPESMPATAGRPGCATIRAHMAWQPGRRALEMPGDPPIVHTWADAGELEAMREDVSGLRSEVDLVLVSCHWGVSGSAATLDYQREIARAAVAAGADLVFGHHPHVVQGAELIDGRPVFYSLGNFAFDGARMRGRHLDGLMLRLILRQGRIADLAVVPVRRGEDNLVRVRDPGEGEGREIMQRFARLSSTFDVAVRARGTDTVLMDNRR